MPQDNEFLTRRDLYNLANNPDKVKSNGFRVKNGLNFLLFIQESPDDMFTRAEAMQHLHEINAPSAPDNRLFNYRDWLNAKKNNTGCSANNPTLECGCNGHDCGDYCNYKWCAHDFPSCCEGAYCSHYVDYNKDCLANAYCGCNAFTAPNM